MQAIEHERMEKESNLRLINQKGEEHVRERYEKDQEIADLRNQLSQASLTQVNKYDFFIVEFTYAPIIF